MRLQSLMRAPVVFTALVAWLAWSTLWGTRAQTPASAAQPARTSFLAGQVVEMPSGRPVPDVAVTMAVPNARGGRGTALTVVTDPQGRFFYANLPPGVHTLSAFRTGFIRARGGNAVIELAEGERVVDARVRLERLASLAGTLRDDAGDPIVGAGVVVLGHQLVSGLQLSTSIAAVLSDDRGAYRVSGLRAGDYLVCACAFDAIPFDGTVLSALAMEPMSLLALASRALVAGANAVSLDDSLQTYSQTFYPDALTSARATRIPIAPGEDRVGVDMTIPHVRATRVSGVVTGARGAVTASAIRLVPADADASQSPFGLQPMLVQPDGRFDFARVPPGAYRLSVSLRDTGVPGGNPTGLALAFLGPRGQPPPPAPPVAGGRGGPSPAPPPLLWADHPLTVSDAGASGIVVPLNRGVSVAGRLEFIGTAPQPPAQQFARVQVMLVPITFEPFSGPFLGGRVAPDATFEVPEMRPGRYFLNVQALPGFPTLKSVLVDGVDVVDRPIVIGERDLRDVVITFTDAPLASLAITSPVDPRRRTDPNPVGVVFPTDRSYWSEVVAAPRRFRTAPMSSKGSAVLTGLPPGEYFVTVVPAEQAEGAFGTAQMIEDHARRAERVRLSEGDKASVSVRR